MAIGGFLSRLGSSISRGLAKIPALFGRASSFATQKVVPAVRKVGEVADVLSRGIGDQAPEGLRKLGSIASAVSQKAGQVSGTIEKGAQIGGEIAKQLGYQESPEVPTAKSDEVVPADVSGGAYMGYNYMRR